MNTLELARLAQLAENAENDLMYGGIFGPNLGIKEDMPNINLPEAFSPDNQNILLRYGEVQRARMRLPEFNQTEYSTGTITAVNGSPTITAAACSWSTSATHKPYWIGRPIVISDSGQDYEYTISALADDGSTITLSDNYAGPGGAGLSYVIGTAGEQVQIPDANTVFNTTVTSSDTFQDLDLSSYVGSNNALVFLEFSGSADAWICVKPKGYGTTANKHLQSQGEAGGAALFRTGVASGTGYLVSATDSSGVIQIASNNNGTTWTIKLVGYVK